MDDNGRIQILELTVDEFRRRTSEIQEELVAERIMNKIQKNKIAELEHIVAQLSQNVNPGE